MSIMHFLHLVINFFLLVGVQMTLIMMFTIFSIMWVNFGDEDFGDGKVDFVKTIEWYALRVNNSKLKTTLILTNQCQTNWKLIFPWDLHLSIFVRDIAILEPLLPNSKCTHTFRAFAMHPGTWTVSTPCWAQPNF